MLVQRLFPRASSEAVNLPLAGPQPPILEFLRRTRRSLSARVKTAPKRRTGKDVEIQTSVWIPLGYEPFLGRAFGDVFTIFFKGSYCTWRGANDYILAACEPLRRPLDALTGICSLCTRIKRSAPHRLRLLRSTPNAQRQLGKTLRSNNARYLTPLLICPVLTSDARYYYNFIVRALYPRDNMLDNSRRIYVGATAVFFGNLLFLPSFSLLLIFYNSFLWFWCIQSRGGFFFLDFLRWRLSSLVAVRQLNYNFCETVVEIDNAVTGLMLIR